MGSRERRSGKGLSAEETGLARSGFWHRRVSGAAVMQEAWSAIGRQSTDSALFLFRSRKRPRIPLKIQCEGESRMEKMTSLLPLGGVYVHLTYWAWGQQERPEVHLDLY